MLSINEKMLIVSSRMLNIQECIRVNSQEIEQLKNIYPVDQETIDGYSIDLEAKNNKMVFLQQVLSNLNNGIDNIAENVI